MAESMAKAIVEFFHDYGAGLFIALGIFTIFGAVRQWQWFVNDNKARVISFIMGGRTGMRLFYIIFGSFLICVGVFSLATHISVVYIIWTLKKNPENIMDFF